MIQFRRPDSFVAGNLSSCFDQWVQILVGYDKKELVLAIIRDGVDIFYLVIPFNGTFQTTSFQRLVSSCMFP